MIRSFQISGFGFLNRKGEEPKVSPEGAKQVQISLPSDFLSSLICINLCDFVLRMDTI